MASASNAETTPSTRAILNSTPLAAKRRVDRIYPSQRCLIENTAPYNMVEYCHCVGRATKSHILSRLERSWRMRPRTLNLDTRYNIIRLGAILHGIFDKAGWILIPETSIINSYFNAKDDPSQFPNIDNRTFTYRLIPHPDMKYSFIHRQVTVESPGSTLAPTDSITHTFPFAGLGSIESHLHPKFVITQIGQAIYRNSALTLAYLRTQPDIFDALDKILATYRAWIHPLGEGSVSGDQDPFNDDDDEDDNDNEDNDDAMSNSIKTRLRRAKGPTAPSYGPMKRQKKEQKPTDGVWLDDETLYQFSRESAEDKMTAIQHWLSEVETEAQC